MMWIQPLALIFLPALIIYLVKRNKFMAFFGVIAWCYLAGMLFAVLTPQLVNQSFSKSLVEVSVLMAIPLLLFSLDIKAWLKTAKTTMLSYLLSILAIFVTAIFWSIYFAKDDPDMWKIAGMLVGVYTGGTVNLTAIGVSLGMEEGKILTINGIDLIASSVYMFFVLLFARKFLALFLPAHEIHQKKEEDFQPGDIQKKPAFQEILWDLGKTISLAAIIVGISVGSSMLIFSKLVAPYIMLTVTTISMLSSLHEKVRKLITSYSAGEYLLYSFCMGLGSMVDLQSSMVSAPLLVKVVFLSVFSAIFIHFLLCYFLKIDGDTALITNVAAVFGPAFVGPVARTLDNRQVVVGGLTCGLLGYAIGNYLGLLTSWLVKLIIL